MPEASRTTLAPRIGEAASNATKPATPSSQPTAHSLRILVVEDDFASREALARAIRLLGYACRTACETVCVRWV